MSEELETTNELAQTDDDSQSLFHEPTIQARILLMRHPETDGNSLMLYQGQSDSALTELGEMQRQRAVEGLVRWQPQAVVSSPIGRCMSIAEPTAMAFGLTVETDERLKEISFGVLEGMNQAEAEQQSASFSWDFDIEEQLVPGAETLRQFGARVMLAGDALAKRSGRMAVITHGGVIRVIASQWLKIAPEDSWSLSVRNVESVVFTIDSLNNINLEAYGLKPEWLGVE